MKTFFVCLAMIAAGEAARAVNRTMLIDDSFFCGVQESGIYRCDGAGVDSLWWGKRSWRNVESVDGSAGNVCLVASGQIECGGPNPILQALVPPMKAPTRVSLSRKFACAIDGGEAKCWQTTEAGPLLPTPKLIHPVDVEFGGIYPNQACFADEFGIRCGEWAQNYGTSELEFRESTVHRFKMANIKQVQFVQQRFGEDLVCGASSVEVQCWVTRKAKTVAAPFKFHGVRSISATEDWAVFAVDDDGLKAWQIKKGKSSFYPYMANVGDEGGYARLEAAERKETAATECSESRQDQKSAIECWAYRGEPALLRGQKASIADWRNARSVEAVGRTVCAEFSNQPMQCVRVAPSEAFRFATPYTWIAPRARSQVAVFDLLGQLTWSAGATRLPASAPRAEEMNDRAGFFARLRWYAEGLDAGLYWERTADVSRMVELNEKDLEASRAILACALAANADFRDPVVDQRAVDASIAYLRRERLEAEARSPAIWRAYATIGYAAARAVASNAARSGPLASFASAAIEAIAVDKGPDESELRSASRRLLKSAADAQLTATDGRLLQTLLAAASWMARP